jgi:transposase
MTVREDKMGQSWLFPPSVADLIDENHICNLVVAVVSCIDVSEIEAKYRSQPGNPAYPRRMLLRLLVQAAIDGVWSSRKIAKLAHENVVYMYLAGNEKPDFRTFCNFRRDNKELIEAVFKETVTTARDLRILKLGYLATDGTKIKANASNDYTLSEDELKEIRRIIERGIEIDEEEDKLYGDTRGDELPPELNTQEKLRKKIRELEESRGGKLKRAAKRIIEQHALGDEHKRASLEDQLERTEEELKESGQNVVSLTDPESRFMENKKERIEPSYNLQITSDRDSGIIVANDVTQDCTDHHQLQPQVELTEETVGELPEDTKLGFDNGYFSGANLRYLEEKGLDGYIPDRKQAGEMKGNKPKMSPFSKDSFAYDEDKDQFICPNGEILVRKGEYEYKGKPVYAYYCANCGECPFRSECAGEGKKRVITSYGYEGERRRMAAKMRSETGKAEYKKRSETVEWIFGNIKQNMKFREFLTRGLESVRTEYNLVCSAHNLKIIWGTVSRDAAVSGKILGSVIHLASKVGNFLRVHRIINLKCHC